MAYMDGDMDEWSRDYFTGCNSYEHVDIDGNSIIPRTLPMNLHSNAKLGCFKDLIVEGDWYEAELKSDRSPTVALAASSERTAGLEILGYLQDIKA
jgi:hypothetical protein